MDPSQPDTVPWSSSELRDIVEHQLATPLAAEAERLAELAHCSTRHVETLIADCGCRSFGDVFQHRRPPLRVLSLVKDFAKASMTDPNGLPRDVGRVLYVLAITRPATPGTEPLTKLDQASIEREARRCLSFGWLPENVRDLIRQGLSRARGTLT